MLEDPQERKAFPVGTEPRHCPYQKGPPSLKVSQHAKILRLASLAQDDKGPPALARSAQDDKRPRAAPIRPCQVVTLAR